MDPYDGGRADPSVRKITQPDWIFLRETKVLKCYLIL